MRKSKDLNQTNNFHVTKNKKQSNLKQDKENEKNLINKFVQTELPLKNEQLSNAKICLQAKKQFLLESKINRMFQKWKKITFNRFKQQIEVNILFDEKLQTLKRECFWKWRQIIIKKQKAERFWRQKIYKAFFKQCFHSMWVTLRKIDLQLYLQQNYFKQLLMFFKTNLRQQQKRVIKANIAFQSIQLKLKRTIFDQLNIKKKQNHLKDNKNILASLHYKKYKLLFSFKRWKL